MKKIRKALILERNKYESVSTEREILKGNRTSESPWLIKMMCSFQDDDNLYFGMEYAPGGNLKSLLDVCVLPEKDSK